MGTPYTKLWIRVLREKQDLAIHSRSSLTSGNEGVCSDQGITPSLLSWVSSGHTIGIPGNDWLTGGRGSQSVVESLLMAKKAWVFREAEGQFLSKLLCQPARSTAMPMSLHVPLLSGTPLRSLFLTLSTPGHPLASQCLVNRTVGGTASPPASSYTLQLCSNYYCIIHGRRPGPASGASWTTGLSLRGWRGIVRTQ